MNDNEHGAAAVPVPAEEQAEAVAAEPVQPDESSGRLCRKLAKRLKKAEQTKACREQLLSVVSQNTEYLAAYAANAAEISPNAAALADAIVKAYALSSAARLANTEATQVNQN